MNPSTPSSDSGQCPTTKQLRDWLNGDQELMADVGAHIRTCKRCSQSLAALSDDEDLNSLAHGARLKSRSHYADEPEFAQLRTKLSQWPIDESLADDASASPPSTQRAEPQATDVDSLVPANGGLDVLTIDALQTRLPADRFVVDRLLATGGSGAVYLAYDQQLQREVAIKVLARDSLRDRQRFLREARLLAELEHPNVVRIFDFGTLSSDQAGQLYLVMEYISGGTASGLGADRKAEPSMALPGQSEDQGTMDYPRLARLVATAADGLAAAHARSLVHRDVKPGNLLLMADWSMIKVADFGLARLAGNDATQVTRTGDLLGTPDFMSPEQVTGDVDVTAASDIYSLGATLYQLLTGVAPYRGGPAAVLRQIAESVPVPPRLIAPGIPLDLETICLHAMQAEPASRYGSMQQLASDLRAFASGQAIHARPESSAKKAVRFLRRNKSLAAVLLACVGLVGVLTIGSIAAAIVFRNQNQRLVAAAASESAAKRAAEDALKASMTAADELLLAVTTETELLPRAAGSQKVTRKLLERARDYFRSFLDANAGNPQLTYQLARAHAGLGAVAMRVGDTETLERETEAALALVDLIPDGEISPAERASFKTDTLIVLANHLTESGAAKRAIPLLDDATSIAKECLSSLDDTETASNHRDLRASYATALFGLAGAMTWVSQRNEALPLLKEARELFERLRAEKPDNASYIRSAAACNITMATIALDQGQAADSQPFLESALELLNQVSEEDSISLRIREMKIKVLTNLALAERRMGNNLEAKANYELAIAESRRLIELEPLVPSHQWNLVVAAMNSGGPEMELGNLEPLVERWQATLPVLEGLIQGDPGNKRYQQVKAMLQSNIAIILRDMGKLTEAIAPLQAATETLRLQAAQLDFSPEAYLPVALNHYELASTFIQLKRWPEAHQALDDSDKIVKEILAKDAEFTPARGHLLDSMHGRLQMLSQQPDGDLTVRQKLAEQSLQLARELSKQHADVAEYQVEVPRALNDLGRVQLSASEFTKATETAQEAHQLLDAIAENEKYPAKEDAPPEWRGAMKNSLLVEAQGLVGGNIETLAPAVREQVTELLQQARKFGASEEDLKTVVPD